MTDSTSTTATVAPEKGTWQYDLFRSADLSDKSALAKKRAGTLLWTGAKAGIEGWMPSSATDVSAENFYNDVLGALGTSRKGDASKIKSVALAVRNNGLDLTAYPNLSKAYAEATRLTKTVRQHEDEDTAAEEAIAAIVAPKTASSQESAAALLLSKGIDGAVVAILDSLGASNFDAHRAFIRAVSTEVSSRVQAAKPKPAPKPPKPAAKKAVAKKATAKPASTKAKPVSASKGDPNKKALPVPNKAKAKPVPVTSEQAEIEIEVEVEQAEVVAENQTAPKPARRAVPVRRAAPRKA